MSRKKVSDGQAKIDAGFLNLVSIPTFELRPISLLSDPVPHQLGYVCV